MSTSDLPQREVHRIAAHTGPVHAVKYNQDGNYILTAGHDRLVRLWNPETGMGIKTYEAHGKAVLALAIPPPGADNTRFATGSEDRAVLVWDVATGRPIRRFTSHHQRVNAVAFNQDATVVVSGSYDASVRFWDCRAANAYKPIQVAEHAKDSVEAVQVVQHEILTGSVDGSIRVYDMRTGDFIADKVGHPVTSASFSGDKNCVLVSSLDSTIRLFDKENGELLNSYTGHKNSEYRITSTLSNTDAHVISGSEDGSILMWDLVEGTLVKRLERAHDRVATCVAYHPSRTAMVSGSVDGTIKVWD
ncbi:WD repeat-containing protein 83 [Geranomyces variabilis]|uniref:WD repeat-containing protein 83 n=1 Tax=Geranomyces variabilis TaxID=109894 RepID=A0AAD5TJT5_9FUNG|nr:WD repeat-containing protein 83 [Geranomyces variabilis]